MSSSDLSDDASLHYEVLTLTLSVKGCTDLKNIVHFYSMRMT